MKRAALITVDMGDEKEVTLRVGVYFGPDSGDAASDDAVADEVHLVEPSERLLADLRAAAAACDYVAADLDRVSRGRSENAAAWRDRAARLRALLPRETQDE